MSKKKGFPKKECCFCGLAENNEIEYGKIYEHADITTHYFCLLLSSSMEQRGNDEEGILGFLIEDIRKQLRKGKKLVCIYCKKTGATLKCCNSRCKKIFHFPCGLKAGALHQFFGAYKSYCADHRLNQKIDYSMKQQIKSLEEVLCCICYDKMDIEDHTYSLWAPCCKNAWFHKKCVQQLAMSAGYFFKCPLCNNKKVFQKEMVQFGIFIPRQDASWELVPNAFQELLHRHDSCNADKCLCPKGRKYSSNNAKWELVLCRTCGSQGIHVTCGQLKWTNPVWDCEECCSILNKSKHTLNSSVTIHLNQRIPDSEDSDTDISVGRDSPIPCTTSKEEVSVSPSPLKLRPGPKSFKLKQILTQFSSTNSQHKDKSSDIMSEEMLPRIQQTANGLKKGIIKIDSDDDFEELNKQVPNKLKDCDNDAGLLDTFARRKDKNTENINDENACTSTSNSMQNFIPNNKQNLTKVDNTDEKSECGSIVSLCNIQITNVTSVPDEICGISDAETEIDITETPHARHDMHINRKSVSLKLVENAHDKILKRKSGIICTTPTGRRHKRRRNDEFNDSRSYNLHDICETESTPVHLNKQTLSSYHNNELRPDNSTNNQKYNTSKSCEPVQCSTSTSPELRNNNEMSEEVENFGNKLTNTCSANSFFKNTTNTNISNNSLKEAMCRIAPLLIKDDEGNTEVTIVRSSTNVTERKTRNEQLLDADKYGINSKSPRSDLTIHLVSASNKRVSNCPADAGVNPEGQPGSTSSITDFSWIGLITALSQKSTNVECNTSSTDCSSVSSTNSTFSTIRTNYNACDNLRLIPETISLKDVRFRVRDDNTIQMVLYDTFSVNIPMRLRSEAELPDQSDIKTVESKFHTPTCTIRDSKFGRNSLECINANVKESQCIFSANNRTSNKYTGVAGNSTNSNDDIKENLDPVTTSNRKQSIHTSMKSNILSAEGTNDCNNDISSRCKHDYTDKCIQSLSWSNSNDGDAKTKDYFNHSESNDEEDLLLSCLHTDSQSINIRHSRLRALSMKKCNTYSTRPGNHISNSTINEDLGVSDKNVQNQDLDFNSLKVSIDLNKIKNVFCENTEESALDGLSTNLQCKNAMKVLGNDACNMSTFKQSYEQRTDIKIHATRTLTANHTEMYSPTSSNRKSDMQCTFGS